MARWTRRHHHGDNGPVGCCSGVADDQFRFSAVFVLWNLFGIADFLDAVLFGTLYNTGLMQRLPLVLIPCFFVPLLFIVHITLLEQWRESCRGVQ
jgi:carbon starvation protein CstA